MKFANVARIVTALTALALIAWGASQIYPPAAPLAVGLLLWLDLSGWRSPAGKGKGRSG